LLGASACGLPDGTYFGKVPDDPDPTHLRFCNSGEPEYLDPALVTSTTGMKLVYAMFAGLTDYNAQGLPEPSVATRWETSADQKLFTFYLRDDARWSNGRDLVADDFVFHVARILHPLTGSRNAEFLKPLAHSDMYVSNRARRVLRASGPFAVGDIVNIIAVGDTSAKDLQEGEGIPDTNLRTFDAPLALRDRGAPVSDAYATAPVTTDGEPTQVTLIELRAASAANAAPWAYVHWSDGNGGNGVYGWVPAGELTGQPNADVVYTVALANGTARGMEKTDPAYRQGTVRGADLLMTPDILGIRAVSDHVLEVTLHSPTPQLISMTPDRIWRPAPREAVSRHPKRWTRPEHIVTSGAFKLTEWRMRDRIVYERNPLFFASDEVALDKITFMSIDDQAASTNLYIQGTCDALQTGHIPSSYVPALRGAMRGGRGYADFTVEPWMGIYFYLINTKKFPNVHFRRALSAITNREPLTDILRGGQLPTASFTPGVPNRSLSPANQKLCGVTADTPGSSMVVLADELCYTPPRGVDFDLELAQKELAIARQEMGADFPKELTVKYNKGNEGHKLVAEYIQHEWQKHLGIPVKLQSQEWKTFLKDTTAGEYEIARMGWIGSYPDPETNFLLIFRCDNPTNRSKYCRPEFEDLFNRAEATADLAERQRLMYEAEKMMLEDAPIVPLYVYTQQHLRKPYVRDLAINLPDQVQLHDVWIDPDWKSKQGATTDEASP